jgi:hypothetical protein
MDQTVALLRLAIAVLTDRTLTLISLIMTFALACWVMHEPSWEREGMAGFFALAVFIPCIIRERPKKEKISAPAVHERHEAQGTEAIPAGYA